MAAVLLSCGALQASGQTAAERPAMAPPEIEATSPGTVALAPADLNVWLDGFMPYALDNAGIVGAVVTIVKDGEVVANRGFGYADLEGRTPVDPDATLFRPGSISKLFTWTAVMQLVEQGRLDLDTDVNEYLDFTIPPRDGQPITLRNIMTHTTGFEEVIRELFDNSAGLALDDYLQRNLPARIYEPGVTPAYSNYATALAGYIVQRVSGEPFPTYMDRHIFAPLGMRNSTFAQPLPEHLASAMSGGYRSVQNAEPQAFEIIGPAPAGSMSSTGADMALFMNAYLNTGEGLLRPETARLVFDTVDAPFPGVNSMAIGFYQNNLNGRRILGHGGDTAWFHSDLALMVDDGVGVFISVNSGGNSGLAPHLLRIEFLKAFVDRYYPAATPTDPEPLDSAREHGAAVAGVYESSRRIESNPLRALSFIDQTEVGMAPNGDLIGPGLPTTTGQPRRWREVEPWVWQEVGGYARMSVRRDADGKVIALAAEPFSFAIVHTRAPWWRASSVWMPLLLGAIAVLALSLVSWPVRAIVRRAHRTPFPYAGGRAVAHRDAGISSGLVLLYLAGWSFFLVWLLESLPDTPESVASAFFAVLYVAGLLPIVALALLGRANFHLWRGDSSWFSRIWAALMVLATIVVIWVAVANSFYSFNFSY